MDHISNCFSAIFNGLRASLNYTDIMQSKQLIPILALLYKDGFISGFETRLGEFSEIPYLRIFFGPRINAIRARFRRVSKPSLRIYKKFAQLVRESKNGDYLILSTTAGIKSLDQVLCLCIGGEVIGRRIVAM